MLQFFCQFSFRLSLLQISNHEKMLESKVPQGIEESLGFSSVSTDLTGISLNWNQGHSCNVLFSVVFYVLFSHKTRFLANQTIHGVLFTSQYYILIITSNRDKSIHVIRSNFLKSLKNSVVWVQSHLNFHDAKVALNFHRIFLKLC